MALQSLIPALAISFMILSMPVYGQINAPCTASMLTSFTPCMNFLTSGSNVTSPPADCCNSLRSLMSNGTGCLCQIATGSIPFQIPINRTLAVSLPRACNMPGVPLQCKASIPPAPAPGPAAAGPTVAPRFGPSPSPQASIVPLSPTSGPSTDSTPALTPASSEAPTSNSERRPSQTPAASSAPSQCFSPLLLLAMFGAIAVKYY